MDDSSDVGFSVPVEQRWFEDYRPGIVCTYGHEAVSEAAILAFAREFDPQYIHTDPAAAKTGPFHGLIASGWHTAAIMMRVIATCYLNDGASLASPGVDELRWIRPVRPGDVLSVRLTVLDARPSQSKPDRGVVHTRVETLNGSGEQVLTMTATNILRRRPTVGGS